MMKRLLVGCAYLAVGLSVYSWWFAAGRQPYAWWPVGAFGLLCLFYLLMRGKPPGDQIWEWILHAVPFELLRLIEWGKEHPSRALVAVLALAAIGGLNYLLGMYSIAAAEVQSSRVCQVTAETNSLMALEALTGSSSAEVPLEQYLWLPLHRSGELLGLLTPEVGDKDLFSTLACRSGSEVVKVRFIRREESGRRIGFCDWGEETPPALTGEFVAYRGKESLSLTLQTPITTEVASNGSCGSLSERNLGKGRLLGCLTKDGALLEARYELQDQDSPRVHAGRVMLDSTKREIRLCDERNTRCETYSY